MSVKPRPTNSPSLLLTGNENISLFQIIGKSCVSLASGVVEVYFGEQVTRTGQRWMKRYCGVACFIKDKLRRSFFIRVFDIKKNEMVWEQELYTQFCYKATREYFHTFEGESCMVGLNFASEDEAMTFQNAVERKLQDRASSRSKKRQARMPYPRREAQPTSFGNRTTGPSSSSSMHLSMMPAPQVAITTNTAQSKKGAGGKKKKKKKGESVEKLSTNDIGGPCGFRHVAGVGWDPVKGFDAKNLDPDLKQVLDFMGISPDKDVDEDTINIIGNVLRENGGIEVLRKELKERPLSVAMSPVAGQPSPTRNPFPPSAKAPTTGKRRAPPPPPSPSPSPLPSSSTAPKWPTPKPPKHTVQAPRTQHRPPPAGPITPPAPPPPPPAGPRAPPAPPAAPPPPPPPALTPQLPTPNRMPVKVSADSGGARDEMLKDIRNGKGIFLKPVKNPDEPKPSEGCPQVTGGIVDILLRALDDRRPHLTSDNENSSEDDVGDDDEDWED